MPEVPADSATVIAVEPRLAIRLAGTVAVNCVALTTLVLRAVLPQFTTAPETKFAPFTVSVNCGPPAEAVAGDRLAMVGTPAALTVKLVPPEAPAGSDTVIAVEPVPVIRLAGTFAVSSVGFPKLVLRAVPPQFTTAPETKFVPPTVRVNAAPPADTEYGARLVMVGAPGALTVKFAADEVTPDVVTVTATVPAVAIRLAGTAAFSWEGFSKVVPSAVLPHCTVEPSTKLLPLTVRVNAAPPASVEEGERPVIAGVPALTVKLTAADLAPNSAWTVIGTVPAVAIRLAETAAVSCVELTNVATSGVLPQFNSVL
jgi:hypothetical protein